MKDVSTGIQRFMLVILCLLAGLVAGNSAASPGLAGARGQEQAVKPGLNTGEVALAAAQDRTITYTYDQAGRLVGVSYGAKSTAYTYDKGGNPLSRQDNVLARVFLPALSKGQ